MVSAGVLERVTRIFGLVVWIKRIDREEVHSMGFNTKKGALGFTDWESRLLSDYAHLLRG